MFNKARSRPSIVALAAGMLAVSGAAGAAVGAETPGGGQRAAPVQAADDGGGINPLCMLRPQDCWPPPGHGSGGGG